MTFVRWISGRPYVYESYMGERVKKGTKKCLGQMQKEVYMGTYEAVRAKHPCGSVSEMLTPRQIIRMSAAHTTYLTNIDARYKVECIKRTAKAKARKKSKS